MLYCIISHVMWNNSVTKQSSRDVIISPKNNETKSRFLSDFVETPLACKRYGPNKVDPDSYDAGITKAVTTIPAKVNRKLYTQTVHK